jgi:MSHA biogenesis protein MshP
MSNRSKGSEHGSAMIAALFLIVVVGALGLYASRLGANQQQTASLELEQFRALHATNAGIEFWSNRIANNNNVACGATPAFDGFALAVACTRIAATPGVVYEITCTATRGTYGTPYFVRRTTTGRVTTIAPGTW